MEKGRNWARQLTDAMQLYDEALPGIPVVEIAGDRRILVECHRGILEYGKEMIRVCVQYGVICISGKDLALIQMTGKRLLITGRIDAVQLNRRCE